MTKPSKGEEFKLFRDQLVGVNKSTKPRPEKSYKYNEDQVSKYGQKAAGDMAHAHRIVMKWVSRQ